MVRYAGDSTKLVFTGYESCVAQTVADGCTAVEVADEGSHVVAALSIRVHYNYAVDYRSRRGLTYYDGSVGVTYDVGVFKSEVLDRSTVEGADEGSFVHILVLKAEVADEVALTVDRTREGVDRLEVNAAHIDICSEHEVALRILADVFDVSCGSDLVAECAYINSECLCSTLREGIACGGDGDSRRTGTYEVHLQTVYSSNGGVARSQADGAVESADSLGVEYIMYVVNLCGFSYLNVVARDGEGHTFQHGIAAVGQIPYSGIPAKTGVSSSLLKFSNRSLDTMVGLFPCADILKFVALVVHLSFGAYEVVACFQERVLIVDSTYDTVGITLADLHGTFACRADNSRCCADIARNFGCTVFNKADNTAGTTKTAIEYAAEEEVVGDCHCAFGPTGDTTGLIAGGVDISGRHTVGHRSRAFACVTHDTTYVVAAKYITGGENSADGRTLTGTACKDTNMLALLFVCFNVGLCNDEVGYTTSADAAEETAPGRVSHIKAADGVAFTVKRSGEGS